jgi:hypothetical protein
MTQPREIEHVLDQWFADGPRQLSDRALTDALSEIDHTRQLGAHVVPWRYSEMPTPVRLLLVAALMAVSAGVALLISAGARTNEPTPSPPSSPAPITLGPGEVIGSDGGGESTADRPAVFGYPAGEFILQIPMTQSHLFAHRSEGPDILLGATTAEGTGAFGLGPTDSCPNDGHYTFSASADKNTFTITATDDSCRDRATLLDGDWHKTWVERQVTPGVRYRIVEEQATIDVTVPSSFVGSTGGLVGARGTVDPNSYIKFETLDISLVFTQPDWDPTAFDRCDPSMGNRAPPTTLDGYVAWTKGSTGVEVTAEASTTVAGFPAVQIDWFATDECQEDFDGFPPTFTVAGIHGREWAVDLGGRILSIWLVDDNRPYEPLTPGMLAIGDAFIQSTEITPNP